MSSDKSKLSHEDRIIWARIARTVEAFPGKELPEDDWFAVETPTSVAPPTPERPAKQVDSATPRPPTPRQQPHPIEKPVIRKLARGRLPIDGRIDLHGLTQSEAHNLLFGFLARAHERGLRHVLVITGKGASRGSEGALKRAGPGLVEQAGIPFPDLGP
jgi:DNA-nicking Smr family endonuclease